MTIHEIANTPGMPTFETYLHSPLGKLFFKMPILLWRLGLQPIVGQLFVLITETGRKSGLPRRTVTEYHVLNGKVWVPCALGEKAQWYRNLAANPHATIQTSRGTEHVLARRITDDDELLAIYRDMHRSYESTFWEYYLKTLGIQDTPEEFLAKKDRVYLVLFEPTPEPTPPPLKADLVWVWGYVLILLFELLWRRRESSSA